MFQPPEMCEAIWGSCRCRDILEVATQSKVIHFKKRFMRWASMMKSKKTSYNAAVAPLPLFYIGVRAGGAASTDESDEPAPCGFLALLIDSGFHLPLFACEESGFVRPGDTLHIEPAADRVKDSTELAWRWLGLPDDATAYSISYKHSGLTDFHVLGVTEMHQLELAHAQSRLQAQRCAALAKSLLDIDKPRCGRGPKRRCAAKTAKAVAKPACEKGAKEVAKKDDDNGGDVDVLDEGDVLAAFDEEIIKEAAAEDEAEDNIGDPSEDEESDAGGVAEAGGPMAETDDAVDEGSGLPAVDEGPGLPHIDAQGSVLNPADEKDIWGRISIMKEGTPGEAVSLYCRRHGCALMRKTATAPSRSAMLRWFALGQDLPKTRDVAVQARHKRMFQDLTD